MVKAVWAEVMATCMQNCFHKANFIDIKTEADPDASEDQSCGYLWQQTLNFNMGHHGIGWDDYICADEDADTAELCTDGGSLTQRGAREMWVESDDDETSDPPRISAPAAINYIEHLRQPVYTKRLSKEHAVALNKLQTAVAAPALQK